MAETSAPTFLCRASFFKGVEFLRECKRQGARVILVTKERALHEDWPRESLADTFYLPSEIPLADIVKAVTHLARTENIDRVVALVPQSELARYATELRTATAGLGVLRSGGLCRRPQA